MAVFPAVLDASVLFNRPVTDTLLRAVEYGLYRVHWSQLILDETTCLASICFAASDSLNLPLNIPVISAA